MKGCTLLCLLYACLTCLQTCLQLYIGFCSWSGIRDVHELNLALWAPVGLVGALALLRKHDNMYMTHIKVKVKVIRPKAWIQETLPVTHIYDTNAGRDRSRGSEHSWHPHLSLCES